MYDSFVFGVKFLVNNSSDFDEHARAIVNQMSQSGKYVHMREKGHRYHQLIIRQRPTGLLIQPFAHQTLLSQNMTDYQPWFDDAIAAILNAIEKGRGYGS